MEEKESDSEMLNSLDSLSVPSEPPDIRNWFSSYEYESVELDTHGDAFGSSAFEESDCGKLGGFGKNCEDYDKQEDEDVSRIPDSADSLAQLSEPPHIKNWFSSYVYESPVLDTVHDLTLSLTDRSGSETEKEGFAYEKSSRKREDDLNEHGQVEGVNSVEDSSVNKPSTKIHDSSVSSSPLSEPPHIRNWFFSYVYESPEVNDLVDEETEREEADFANQLDSKATDNNLCKSGKTRVTDLVIEEKVRPNRLPKLNRLLRDEQEYPSLNKSPGSESSCNEDNLSRERGSILGNNTFTNRSIGSTKEPGETSLNEQQQKQTSIREADFTPCKGCFGSSNNIRISSLILTSSVQREDVPSHIGRESIRKSNWGRNDKENEGKREFGQSFVTVKKSQIRSNEENYLTKPQKILSECSSKKTKTASDGNVAMKRKVLSERTNLEMEQQGVTTEVTGKWRCPRKSKPNTGPPMKQLRLERWVHRLR